MTDKLENTGAASGLSAAAGYALLARWNERLDRAEDRAEDGRESWDTVSEISHAINELSAAMVCEVPPPDCCWMMADAFMSGEAVLPSPNKKLTNAEENGKPS